MELGRSRRVIGSRDSQQRLDLGVLPLHGPEVRRDRGMSELAGQSTLAVGDAGERPIGSGQHGVDARDAGALLDLASSCSDRRAGRRRRRREARRSPPLPTVRSSRGRPRPGRGRASTSRWRSHRRRSDRAGSPAPDPRAGAPPGRRTTSSSSVSRRSHRRIAISAAVVRASVRHPPRRSTRASRSASCRVANQGSDGSSAPANRPRQRATKRPFKGFDSTSSSRIVIPSASSSAPTSRGDRRPGVSTATPLRATSLARRQ